MRRRYLGPFTLGISAAAMLSGCGISQQSIPMQREVSAPARTVVNQATRALPYEVLYRFADHGHHRPPHRPDGGDRPWGSPIDMNGTLYGTTLLGGEGVCTGGCGTVYSISKTGGHKVLHHFQGFDGASPIASLVDVNGTLYGTTAGGGGDTYDNLGTVYSVSTTGAVKVLHRFTGGSDGANPWAGLTDVNGTLYGTTVNGGSTSECGRYGAGCGTVYSISAAGAYQVLYRFKGGSDGALPYGGVIAVKGTLYGTTDWGGRDYQGTVFSITNRGAEKVRYSFKGPPDAGVPQSGLIDVDGTLYGTTVGGGVHNSSKCDDGCGAVYSISTSGKEKVLHSFGKRTDGSYPESSLIDVKGTLYGTTSAGGKGCADYGGCGTVFSVTPAGVEEVLYSFGGKPDGAGPRAGLTAAKGVLYGTTYYGGGGGCEYGGVGCGTIFAMTP